MYWRYSANSTLNPLYGLRCRPDRNPSTTVRAFSSIVPSRAMIAGSRNLRSRVAERGGMASHSAAGRRDRLEQPLDEVVGRDALRLRIEVRDHAMTKHGLRQRLDVPDRHVVPAQDE